MLTAGFVVELAQVEQREVSVDPSIADVLDGIVVVNVGVHAAEEVTRNWVGCVLGLDVVLRACLRSISLTVLLVPLGVVEGAH